MTKTKVEATLRLKMLVESVGQQTDNEGNLVQENITLNAVHGKEGTVNNQWSKWTPSGRLAFSVTNPAAFGKAVIGQFYFVDLIPTTKDAA